MRRGSCVLALSLSLAGGAIWLAAQNAGDTLPLPRGDSSEGSSALYDAMETVGTTVTTYKTEGVDKTMEEAEKHFQKLAEGNRHAAKQMSGLTKGADARAWQSAQAGKAGFFRKLKFVGDLVEIVDAFSGAAGYLAEGDTTGAAAIFVNGLGKKGASALTATAGSVAGPVGTIVGAEAGDRAYKEYVEGKVNKLADDKRDRDARDRMLGVSMTGRYSGSVLWVTTPQYNAASGAPPMTFRFQGPMTADLDRNGNLTMHYDLRGTMDGLGIAGQSAGIGMALQMSVTADLAGVAKDGRFTAKGQASNHSTFNVDYGGRMGAPQNQSQSSSGSGAVSAVGTFTRETLEGTVTSAGVQAKPITFTLTKQR